MPSSYTLDESSHINTSFVSSLWSNYHGAELIACYSFDKEMFITLTLLTGLLVTRLLHTVI